MPSPINTLQCPRAAPATAPPAWQRARQRLGVSLLASVALLLCGCASLGTSASGDARARPAPDPAAASDDPLALLIGEFDDYEQIVRVASVPVAPAAKAGGKPALRESPPLRVHQRVRLLERKADSALLLWQQEVVGAAPPVNMTWLYRVTLTPTAITLLPYRPLDSAALTTRLADTTRRFDLRPEEWVELDACAMHGANPGVHFVASVDGPACNLVLPGIGAGGALLPLRVDADATTLRLTTFADQARGPGALQEASRARVFTGFGAINGAGPRGTMESTDWHQQRGLRLHDQGGRIALTWRDGGRSGYSIELTQLLVASSQSRVLKLALVEDATGRTLSYVWASPTASIIGMHLGWVQIGLELASANAAR